jgi:hypothetical protein
VNHPPPPPPTPDPNPDLDRELSRLCKEMAPAMTDAHLEPCDPDEWRPCPPRLMEYRRPEGCTFETRARLYMTVLDIRIRLWVRYVARLVRWWWKTRVTGAGRPGVK